MSDQEPITIPPVNVLRAELTAKQAEVRRLRKLLLLAKAVSPSATEPEQADADRRQGVSHAD